MLRLSVALLAVTAASARIITKHALRERQLEAAQHWQTSWTVETGGTEDVEPKRVQNITFTNPKASEFYVDGTSLPLIDFDVGPSWSGLLPISDSPDETRQLFFWFFPPGPDGSLDDLIFWTNGGPGCSSLEGLLQENGPFSWSLGQAKPTVNEYSWTNLSSVLWVEQPVGTGFSQGVPNAQNEEDVAAQLAGFLQQFLEVFAELKGKQLYLTGESYAGTYVPYLANYIYENPTLLDLSLQGMWISDPSLSWDVVQEQIPAVDFVNKYAGLFSFNQTFTNYLEKTAARCNYTGYVDKYVTYPPAGLLPLPGDSVEAAEGCDVWDDIFNNALIINPAFNIYRIWDTYPVLWDVLGAPGSIIQSQTPLYFDRTDVKQAIHAPVDTEWTECSNINVFPNGDGSLPPAFTVLPNVIEKNKRTVIVHGLADFVLISDGTRIVIQNMTWNGLQGFQTPIADDSFIVDGVGAFGTMHSERGLTYFEVVLSGHMVPQFAPVAAFQIMQYLMGFRDTP
ncbi:Alpha/Beta hydrolase protein [Suillus fuscotomentosus]|uniref:Carboxypeptidase n=1 Tax=Suillus fuscotomentosus TaxID=1912939 RepID=A0AAD4HJB7_9AGAM|nr:Alpha/Beta hydrolase protein [Suillus fuscotomentosus]KAG1897584.1 Alpha/Beta hydrolase protein [Suillus fuscotomentosus]